VRTVEWFDGHLDLTYIALHGRDMRREVGACGGTLMPATVTFPTLRAGGVRSAFSTLFVRRRTADVSGEYCFETPDEALAAAMRQVRMHEAWEREGWIELENRQKQEARNKKEKRSLRVRLAMEGAAPIREVGDAEAFVKAGVRMVSLAWAEGNKWAGGDQSGGDVTADGRALIKRLDELGIVHDVSHLSERAFWTVMELAQGRVVASHSNCRALLPGAKHPERHLSDEQLRALAARKGSLEGRVGVCLFSRFLVPAEEHECRRATLADVVRHLEHMADVMDGRRLLALGSDFDSGYGAEMLPIDLQGPTELWRLAEALAGAGWEDEEIETFARGWETVG
jgi:membrane dipeptidase